VRFDLPMILLRNPANVSPTKNEGIPEGYASLNKAARSGLCWPSRHQKNGPSLRTSGRPKSRRVDENVDHTEILDFFLCGKRVFVNGDIVLEAGSFMRCACRRSGERSLSWERSAARLIGALFNGQKLRIQWAELCILTRASCMYGAPLF